MSAQLLKRFQNQAAYEQDRLDKFAADFAKDPSYALSWGTDAFKSAAKLKILKQIVAALQEGATLDNVKDTVMDRVLNKSKYPPQSTSPTSNLMEQYELASYAEILDDLKYL